MTSTNYFGNTIISTILRGGTQFYASLHDADPGATPDPNTELVGNGYARQPVDFIAPSTRQTSNDAAIQFSSLPAATVTHVGVWDAVTGGNMLFSGALDVAAVIAENGGYEIALGDLAHRVD